MILSVTLLDLILLCTSLLRQVGITGSLTASRGKVGEAPGRGRIRRSAGDSKSLRHFAHKDAVFGSFFRCEEFSMFLEKCSCVEIVNLT